MADVEQRMNVNDQARALVLERLETPAPDLRTAVGYYQADPRPTELQPDWVNRMLLCQVKKSGEPPPRPADAPYPPRPIPQTKTFVVEDVVLKPPATKPYPDHFYAEVGRIYRRAVQESDRPAVWIAQAADVPVKTVHGWVAEARKRGHLAPGRAGRAG